MLHVELKVVGGKNDSQIVPLNVPKFLIGREQDCQLRPNSELVSRHHCVFTVDEYSVRLRDLGSTNGTLVNGERIQGLVELKQGDLVNIGSLDFEVQVGQPALVAEGAGGDAGGAMPDVAPAEDNVATTADTQLEDSQSGAGSETVMGMPALQANNPEMNTGVFDSDATVVTPSDDQAPSQDEPLAPPAAAATPPAAEMPPAAPPPMAPMQYPMQGYPPGYAPMPGAYPQMPYPQQPYPAMPYPQQQMPFPGAVPEEPLPSSADDTVSGLPSISLPPPEETGLKEEQDSKGSGGSNPADKDQSTSSAADIIKQYMQRRPNT